MKTKLFIIGSIIFLSTSLFSLVEAPEYIKTVDSTDKKRFANLAGIALTPRNEIVLVDEGKNALYWLNRSGEIVKTVGKSGRKDSEFSAPRDIFIDSSGKIFIADTGNNRIQVFDKKGTFLFKFGKKGSKNGEFKQPSGIFVSKQGNIYVADRGNNRVQIFSKDGTYIAQFGSSGKNKGEFANPLSVAVDEREHVYVLDSGNKRIQAFDENGVLVKTFGGKGNKKSKKKAQFKSPEDIHFHQGKLYITDAGYHLIQVYEKSGQHFASLAVKGRDGGNLESLEGWSYLKEVKYI